MRWGWWGKWGSAGSLRRITSIFLNDAWIYLEDAILRHGVAGMSWFAKYLVITQPKSLYSFTIPWRVEGWRDLRQNIVSSFVSSVSRSSLIFLDIRVTLRFMEWKFSKHSFPKYESSQGQKIQGVNECSTERKFSLDFSLPGTKVLGNEKSRHHYIQRCLFFLCTSWA